MRVTQQAWLTATVSALVRLGSASRGLWTWLTRLLTPTTEVVPAPKLPEPKKKIAILGGGMGAMTAAFELTDRPGWQNHYDITVYQMGWRLGGKCASGRNLEPGLGKRIEEHGVHVWFGFYDNAFQMIKKCYAEYKKLALQPPPPIDTWQKAFKEQNLFTLMEQRDDGWHRWEFDFPPNDKVPGESEALEPWDYVCMLLRWLVHKHETSPHLPKAAADHVTVWGHSLIERVDLIWREATSAVHVLWEEVTTFISNQVGALAHSMHLHVAHELCEKVSKAHEKPTEAHHDALKLLLHGYREKFLQALNIDDEEVRKVWILLHLGVTIAIGMIESGVLIHGFEWIDEYDLTEWLQMYGAADPEIYWSAPVRGIYDGVFGFAGGNTDQPNLAAGTALRGSLRLFLDYKGAFCWKMQAGMGDIVFTPLYKVLKHRGVKFNFFHRVENLRLSKDGQYIDAIDMTLQATVKNGEYQPLIEGLRKNNSPGESITGCWPSSPLYDQLEEGEELKKQHINLESPWCRWSGKKVVLKRGTHFDEVVLGIPLGMVRYICQDLIDAKPDTWGKMVDKVKTVPTQAFQLWLNRDIRELGWVANERAIVASYVEPLDTWADMSQVIDKEDWPADVVKNIAYFCGPLKEVEMPPPFKPSDFLEQQRWDVRTNALDFLKTDIRPLWPKATVSPDSDVLNWDLLVAPNSAHGEDRFNYQYWRANADPSERYVLSVKGSTHCRLRSDQSGFDNLYLAGDWTYTALNVGCVEAAVMSGMRAAHGIRARAQVSDG
jgi:uncharacterized protein with NAD-binding domain and iron-sulfur cluster